MKQIAIIMWVVILLLLTSKFLPGLWTFGVLFIFVFVAELLKGKKEWRVVRIILLIAATLTVPVVLLIDILQK